MLHIYENIISYFLKEPKTISRGLNFGRVWTFCCPSLRRVGRIFETNGDDPAFLRCGKFLKLNQQVISFSSSREFHFFFISHYWKRTNESMIWISVPVWIFLRFIICESEFCVVNVNIVLVFSGSGSWNLQNNWRKWRSSSNGLCRN